MNTNKPLSEVYLMDCMELMKRYPDNHFDLAVVDPPYGNNLSGGRSAKNGWNNKIDWDKCNKGWNLAIPTPEYFAELQRVSKNQIVWGGNYFPLPPSQGFLIWDKKQPQDFSLAMCEFAWSSIQSPAKMFRFSVLTERNKIHPTQKPVKLYEWLLTNYANKGDKILDTHVGSGSSRIACQKMGFDFTGYEIDEDYFEAQEKRYNEFISQLTLRFV
jgi:site-specific DNA-methyltransferase (adenine-specific)